MSEHYLSYSEYLKKKLGGKTYKVVVSSGLSCPTRDGLLDQGGCAFCDVRGSSSFFGKVGRGKEIREQIDARLPRIKLRFHSEKFIAYFQSYTNTYSDLAYLREIYDAALSHPEISGLAIGTRPDCLSDEVIDLLEEYAQKTFLTLELGVQSFEDPTLLWLERGHDGECSRDALRRLKLRAPNVDTCVHLMFGSPTDSVGMAEETAQELNRAGVSGVKLHQLMVLQRTKLATRYQENAFKTLTLPEYAEIVERFLAHLNPEIYVERLTATSSHPEECIAPEWSRSRWDTHNQMRDFLAQKRVRQGSALQEAVTHP
jgi:uncharacterized protein